MYSHGFVQMYDVLCTTKNRVRTTKERELLKHNLSIAIIRSKEDTEKYLLFDILQQISLTECQGETQCIL